jgi:hypothetical protein
MEMQQTQQQQTRPQHTQTQMGKASLLENETQLTAIRELMMRALCEDAWLTLGEIADATEFGEASISAQLRHLRKARHGRYRVEKRRRKMSAAVPEPLPIARNAVVIWEYRVLPPG